MISHIEQVEIEDKKFGYLRSVKKGKLMKANLIDYSKENLIDLIKSKIRSNYVYNMTDVHSFGIFRFDILIELINNIDEVVKMTIGFEYIPNKKELRLITMY